MQFAYTILYVGDVPAALTHYESAFGCAVRFIHESGLYGELETGGTVLAFAAYELAEMNDVAMRASDLGAPTGPVNITFASDDVPAAYERATANGARPVAPPKEKPWGQMSSYVRDLDGHLVEIASPILERHGASEEG